MAFMMSSISCDTEKSQFSQITKQAIPHLLQMESHADHLGFMCLRFWALDISAATSTQLKGEWNSICSVQRFEKWHLESEKKQCSRSSG